MIMAVVLADAILPVPDNCANRTIYAAIRTAVPPTYPDSAANASGHVVVRVTVNDDGSVGALAVAVSSGSVALDDAAMRAAGASTYTAEFVNCAPVSGGYYSYQAEFGGSKKPTYAVVDGSPSCKFPILEPTVTNPVAPVYPVSARALNLDVITVLVEVTLSPSGKATGAKLNRSSGNLAIDRAAVRAALDSTYAPSLVNCKPVVGDYIMRVEFDPKAPAPKPSP